jgi:hypothetical protein
MDKKISEYTKNAPNIKTTVHWYDLPERTIIKLDPEFQKDLMSKLFNRKPKMLKRDIANLVGVGRAHLHSYFTLKSNFTVKSLFKIAKLTNIHPNVVEKYILEIGRKKTIKNPKFPFRLDSPSGIALRSIVNSEGHIPEVIGTSMHIRVPEIEMLQKAISFAKDVFGEFDVEIKPTKGKNTNEIFFPSEIAEVLIIGGLTRGRKSNKNPAVPKDIMLGSLEQQKVYLQWSFASEMECSGKVIKLTRNVTVSDILPKPFIKKLKEGVNYKNGIPSNILELLERKPPKLLLGELLLLINFGILRGCRISNLWKAKSGRVSAA